MGFIPTPQQIKGQEKDKMIKQEESKRILEQVESEIRKAFDNWDNNIKAGLNPVPIQDLDFWSEQLKKAISC